MSAPLLSVSDLSVKYQDGSETVHALQSVSLDLAAGERLAILGESGSGKSTLALALGGLLPRGTRMEGTISWPGFPNAWPANGRDIGFVFQDPSGSLDPLMTVGDQIAEVIEAHRDLGGDALRNHALELLARVRLPPQQGLAEAYPHQLSGGQRQRVAIACAIAAGPRLLIADEATSALDTVVQGQIADLIEDLVKTDRLSLVFITHDLALASQLADRVAVFQAGRLMEEGTVERIIGYPQTDYVRQLISAHISLDSPRLVGEMVGP